MTSTSDTFLMLFPTSAELKNTIQNRGIIMTLQTFHSHQIPLSATISRIQAGVWNAFKMYQEGGATYWKPSLNWTNLC